MTDSQQTTGEHAFASGEPFCTICCRGGIKPRTVTTKEGIRKKEQANTSAEAEGFLEHVMMTCKLGITKDDPAVKSINQDITKIVTNAQDLKQLQVTEVCHLGHFWLSYGRCVMSGSPTGCLVGCPDDAQTKQKIPEVYYMACFR